MGCELGLLQFVVIYVNSVGIDCDWFMYGCLVLLLCRFVAFAWLVIGGCLICVVWFAYFGW